MKYQNQLLLLGFVLFISIIISLSNIEPLPYHNENLFTKEYKYTEGLATKKEENIPNKSKNTGIKTEGFAGLQSAPYNEEKPIDIFSQLPSGGKCTSSPYSNSQGYLCLDENAKNLLLTRGGNQTGKEHRIGTP